MFFVFLAMLASEIFAIFSLIDAPLWYFYRKKKRN